MDNQPENQLTKDPWGDIIPTANEKRILFNLRNIAKASHYGTVVSEIYYHKDQLKNGQVLRNRPKL